MRQDYLEKLIERLRSVHVDSFIVVAHHRISDEVAREYEETIDCNFELFLDDDLYPDEESVIEGVKEIIGESDGSWMFDVEENEERNEFL
ncbi:MAG: hypothetical protein J6X69_08220 [Bacteroidales bacterium]|nr:hypothetical protein [Bacteroidales bacterium]